MLENELLTTFSTSISKFALAILASLCIFGIFVAGFDQGHIFSIIQGADAFDVQYLHELTHDMRHAAGFPCH